MFLYSIILLAVSLPFAWISVAIYRGKTDLIHSYHRTNVSDHAAYGKAFGKAMLLITFTMILSGIVALMGSSDGVTLLAVAVLLLGLCVGLYRIAVVQKKYNGGFFD